MRVYRMIIMQYRKASLFVIVAVCIATLLFLSNPIPANAQIRAVYDRGATGLGQMLKRLNTSASVLMIGAHPDDEDTALLTYLARGENARTAYLSLTRGDGGQNILGTELGESLGLIRTEELIQARRLDGAEQYFTRAYDYGFSKTLAEAKQKWDERIVLCDTVRVIRKFRPLVVVSQFSGTTADGHGQHQYSGYISPLAVKAASDAGQCTESGPVWTVRKFYVRHRGAGEARLRINTGKYDSLLGRSYFEIAMEARSQHRSQEQGVLELKGEQFSAMNLIGSEARETGIFDGIDSSITGAAANTDNSEPSTRQSLKELGDLIERVSGEFDIRTPEKILIHLVNAYGIASKGAGQTSVPGTKAFFDRKKSELTEVIQLVAGIQTDALADRETVVPGESFSVAVKTFVALKLAAKTKSAKIITPPRWTITQAEAPNAPTQGFFRRETGDFAAHFTIGVPSDAMPTEPYWLAEPRDRDLFRWRDNDDYLTLPFHPPIPTAEVTMDILGTEIVFRQPVEYRYADDTRGEIRRFVNVVPMASVELDQPLLIVPYSDKPQIRKLVMTVINHSNKAVTGTASLNIDNEWKYETSAATFNLNKPGERSTITFNVTIPAKAKAGSYPITGQAMIGEALGSTTLYTISYPHIQTHRIYRRAKTEVQVFDLKVEPVKVGYVFGSGDRVADAIRQMGLDVEMLNEKQLASGNLSLYDVIVVGIRASEVRPDFAANNQRLLEFARNGGTLIVQYQRPGYAGQGLTPYPTQIGPRVVDENAPVTILDPTHSMFNFPNKITDADFAGWVQERNLYNFSMMDAKYTDLLESHDPGEAENKGGLVIADVGKGKFIYCSYSLFRQLPAGVSGAYRLLANMLSQPKARM